MKNLTPHAIRIHDEAGKFLMEVPPSGTVARVSVGRVKVGEQEGVPVFVETYGEVEGLPDAPPMCPYCESANCVALQGESVCGPVPEDERVPEPETLIVSLLVKTTVKRQDLVSPGELIRDEQGRPIGCKGLSL
jgi:hypothetical protein